MSVPRPIATRAAGHAAGIANAAEPGRKDHGQTHDTDHRG